MNPVQKRIIAAAVDYSRRFSVLPVKADKKPCVRTWLCCQSTRTPPERVPEWFAKHKLLAGVGIVLGGVSGDLYARDFDDPESYARWASAFPDLARTLPTVKTPRRGFHVYARWQGVRTDPMDDGELRGEGAYVVAPPTVVDSGGIYAWVVPLPEGDVPEVDPEVAGLAQSWRSESNQLARATESTERTEPTERTERTEPTEDAEDTEDDEAIRLGWCTKTRDAIESAIVRTLPTDHGKRNTHLFRYVRALKAIPPLASIPPRRVRILRPIAREWHARALPNIWTKDFGTTWGDFVHAWGRVKFAEGEDVLGAALAAAEQADPPTWAADYSPACKLLASLCRELQRRAAPGPFFLSAQTAGACVAVDKGTACRWLLAFVADGALTVETKGSTKTGRASRYRYVADDLNLAQ